MRCSSILTLLLTGTALAAPSYNVTGNDVQTLANGKANEYTDPGCKDDNGGNKPSYPHKPVCGCVRMDTTTTSVYIATSPGQRVYAYRNGACNPEADKSGYLGKMGGQCSGIESTFKDGSIGSLQFYTPVICDIANMFKDLPQNIADIGKEILDIIV